MKIKLLNDGGYGDMEAVGFPVVVEAREYSLGYLVLGEELIRVGATVALWDATTEYYFGPMQGDCEVLP